MATADNRTDKELVEVCNTGTRAAASAAFDALYQRHKDYVLRVAFRYTDDADLALDVLQNTFVYLLRKFPPPGDGLELTARLETLLYVAAKNAALTLHRDRDRQRIDPEQEPDALPATESTESGQPEIAPLMRGLSPNEREIIQLRFVDGLQLTELAVVLDVPLGTVKSRLHKAVTALRNSPYAKEFFEK